MATFGTFVSGQVLTAAELNALGTWTAFTPAWSGITVGNGTQSAFYSVINKILFVKSRITFGTTSVMTGFPQFTMPNSLTASSNNQQIFGTAASEDTGVASYIGSCYLISSTSVRAYVHLANGTYSRLENITSTVPMTWGNSDVLLLDFMVQVN
jgi:hypothetical protein